MGNIGVLNTDKHTGQGRLLAQRKSGSSLCSLAVCIALAVTIVLQQNLFIKCLQCVSFIVLAFAFRQKMHGIGILLLFVSTVSLNLLVWEGRILITVLSFPVTEDALWRGLKRGLTLVTLFFMSKACLNVQVPVPGAVGRWLARVLHYVFFLTGEIGKVRFKYLLDDLDRIMIKAEQATKGKSSATGSTVRLTIKYWHFCAILAGNLILLILQYGVR